MKQAIIDIATQAAERHGLDSDLVLAIIEQESAGNPWANRYEEGYPYLYPSRDTLKAKAPCSRKTEVNCQQQSYGLMQVIGSTAREVGFEGIYLTELCDPQVNCEIGCLYLKKLLLTANGSVEVALECWNAGHPGTDDGKQYAREVLARYYGRKVPIQEAEPAEFGTEPERAERRRIRRERTPPPVEPEGSVEDPHQEG
jgi:hypothetical protein